MDNIITSSFIIINIDTFKLKIRITMICAIRIDTMFIGNNLPKLEPEIAYVISTLN
jgi:hypothetical protein